MATFPTSFLSRLMICGDNRGNAGEALEMYKDLLNCEMIILPFMKGTHSAVVAVVNPGGVLDCKLSDRSGSFVLFLDPGKRVTKEDMSKVSRRLRHFLNRVKEAAVKAGSWTETETMFNGKNLPFFTVKGEILRSCAASS